jgi:hypothetical protein
VVPQHAAAVAAAGAPTGNTWAASHADIPKNSSAPLLLIAGLGALLFAGAAFGAYKKFGPKPADAGTTSAALAAKAAPSATPPALTAAPVVAPVPVVSAAPLVSPSPAASAALAAEVAKPQASAKPAALAKPAPVAARPGPAVAAHPPAPKPKAARDFGY